MELTAEEPVDAIAPDIRDREQVVDLLMNEFHRLRNWRTANMDPIWKALYRAYRGFRQTGPSPYKNTLTLREIFRQIETQVPQIAEQLLGQERNFRYKPRQEEGQEDGQAATEIVSAQIEDSKIEMQQYKWLHTTAMYGTAYMWPRWEKLKHTQWKISSLFNDEKKEIWQRKPVEQIRGMPTGECLGPWEVFTNPYVEEISESPFVFVRKIASADDLKTYAAEGVFDKDAVEEALKDSEGGSVLEILKERPGYDVSTDLDTTNLHDLLWCWTNDGMQYAVVNKKHLLMGRRSPTGKCELHAERNYPQAGEHYGIAEIMVIIDDQKLLNDLMGMVVDGIHLTGNPMFKVKKGAESNFKRATYRPGGYMALEDMNDVEPLAVTPTVDGVLNLVQFTLNRMQVATGSTEQAAGTAKNTGTATGIVRLQDAASVRVKNKVRLFMPAFRDFYAALFQLNAMYLDYDVALRIIGPDGAEVFRKYEPKVFSSDVDVEVQLSNQMESGPEATNKWLNIIKLGGQDPMLNRQTIWERVFRAMGERRLRPFFSSSTTSQSDALDDIQQVVTSGNIGAALPGDNHQVHIQVKQMFMATPTFEQLAAERPVWAKALADNLAQHMEYQNQMLMAQQQAQQAQFADQGAGETPVGEEANGRANAMFDMAATGAMAGGGGF